MGGDEKESRQGRQKFLSSRRNFALFPMRTPVLKHRAILNRPTIAANARSRRGTGLA